MNRYKGSALRVYVFAWIMAAYGLFCTVQWMVEVHLFSRQGDFGELVGYGAFTLAGLLGTIVGGCLKRIEDRLNRLDQRALRALETLTASKHLAQHESR